MSAENFSTFTFDQTLRARRGVKRCREYWSSSPVSQPSIQPQHSAISTASA